MKWRVKEKKEKKNQTISDSAQSFGIYEHLKNKNSSVNKEDNESTNKKCTLTRLQSSNKYWSIGDIPITSLLFVPLFSWWKEKWRGVWLWKGSLILFNHILPPCPNSLELFGTICFWRERQNFKAKEDYAMLKSGGFMPRLSLL